MTPAGLGLAGKPAHQGRVGTAGKLAPPLFPRRKSAPSFFSSLTTSQCWILNAFFNCPPTVAGLQCPTAAEQANVTLAINKGFLTWHAFPENGEAELHGAGLFRMGVGAFLRYRRVGVAAFLV